MPYDHQLTFQDGRPLIYDSGDFPASLDKLKALVGWDDVRPYAEQARADGRKVGLGLACYVEGTGVGPYEGAHVVVETSGKVKVATGLTTQGQGHFTSFAQIVADELGVPLEDVEVVTGDTRRFGYAVGTFASRAAVMSGNAIALASRKVRAKALRIAGDALEADPGDLEIVDGVVRVKGSPGVVDPAGDGRGAVQPAALRVRRGVQGGDAVRRRRHQRAADRARTRSPVSRAPTTTRRSGSTFANGMHAVAGRDRPRDRRDPRSCATASCTTAGR